jgi:hypothetical protein
MKIDRILILDKLAEALEPINFVNALWLEGADSLGTVDEYSDIDVWVDADDGKESEAIEVIRNVLRGLGELDFDYEKEHGHPKIRQHFFHIKDTSKYLIVDLCIQANSRIFWFTEGMDGEKVKVLFDKKNVINFKPLNKKKFIKENMDRRNYLLGEFKIMKVDVEKELERGDYLGALNFYLSLASIFTELQRLEHTPTKHEFGLKHASRDLPETTRNTVNRVYTFTSVDDLKQNIDLMLQNV